MGSAAFGGLGLLWGSAQAQAQDGLLGPTMERMKIILFWSFFLVLVGALALVSNPTDASFRSYLTELSFRRHLRELHRPSPPADADLDDFSPSVGHLKPNGLNSTSNSSTNPRTSGTQQDSSLLRPPTSSDSTSGPSSTQASPSHLVPFRFANRVSISLRTPPYVLRDFAFFSLVTVSPNQVLSVKGRGGARKAASWLDAEQSESLLAGVWFIGIFGRWWMAGSVRSQMDPSAGEDEMRAGVIGLKALDGSEDPVAAAVRKAVSGTDSSSLNASPSSPSRSTTRAARPRSRRPSIDAITISPPEKPSPPPPSIDHHILPLHQQRPLIQQENQHHQRTLSTSSADLHPPASLPSSPSSDASSLLPPIDPLLFSTNPALAELHTAFLASQSSTADLRSQLGQSSAASEAAQSQLQASLDGLRLRKREEDNDRLEVKSRTKALEDGKRQAETGKREADKKLKVTEGLRDAVLARIEVLTKQVNEAKEKMRVQREEMEGSNETIKKREGEVREETKSKREQLVTVEEGLGTLGVEVKELDLKARDEEASLEVAKEEALAAFEAEVRQQQSSFAPFGAPQPRSVENDYYGQHSSSNPHPPPPSSTSHPTSLFDLPIQQLPLSLLHRRRQLTEPVASSSDFGPGLPAQLPSSFSANDVFGFEDFGPGVPSQSRRYDYDHQQDLASSNGHSYSNYSRPIPPSIHTDDYSTEEDPGSPGPMSASFTNLLPRGLFQSLSAEGLLSPDGFADPSSPFTAAFNRASLDSDESFLLDIDTETEQPGSRRLSLTDADIFFPADENLDEGDDQLFDMPQRTPSDTYLPSSPRSVFSDDPRSLLLDPYADENFSYPPPGIDSLTFANSTNLLDFVDRSSPTTSSTRPTSSHGHQSSTSDDPFLRQRPFAIEPTSPASVPAVPSLPSGIRTMEEVAEREPEDEDDDHVSPEIEHATATTTTTLAPAVEVEAKPASKFTPKRWFSSNKVHAHVSPSPNPSALPPPPPTDASASASSLLDPKLNPDAKAFSFKGFSALRGNSSSSATGTTSLFGGPRPPSDLSVSSAPFVPSAPPRLSQESLLARPHGDDFPSSSNHNHPTASSGGASNTSRFFSSLRAFAPSAAEREALTRALRQNGSSKSIDGFMGGSAADRGEGNAGAGPGASPTYQHASPYGYANGGGGGSGTNVGRGGVVGSGRLVASASSPFATPQTSATNLVGDRRAAAAWDVPERPIVQADQSVSRRKSFRFFNLASSFSRKQTSEEDLHLAAAGTIGHPRPANNSNHHDSPSVNPPTTAPSEARSSGATIVDDWAPSWGALRKKEVVVVTDDEEDEDDASEDDGQGDEAEVEKEQEQEVLEEVGEKE